MTTIESAIENDFVTAFNAEKTYTWIGLTDQDAEVTYTLVNGEPLFYANWDTGQPNSRFDKELYGEIAENDGK